MTPFVLNFAAVPRAFPREALDDARVIRRAELAREFPPK